MSTRHPTPAIELRNVSKRFRATDTPLYDGLSLSIEAGKSLAIVGPSGCGKTTLLNIIALAELPDSGQVIVNGHARGIGDRDGLTLAYIFQRDALLPWATVLENALLGVACKGPVTDVLKTEAMELLERVGLEGCDARYPGTLSGGQKQLVALVQNLLIKPDILILDEPFAHLDFQTKLFLEAELLSAIRIARSSKDRLTTLVLVTHDLEEAIVIADRLVVVGRHPNRPMEIARDLRVPISDGERDPVIVRESGIMRDIFQEAWSAIRTFVVREDRTVTI